MMSNEDMRRRCRLDERNQRLRIVTDEDVSASVLDEVIEFSREREVGKVICNCHAPSLDVFQKAGFEFEASIPGFFKGEKALCMSFFVDDQRSVSKRWEQEEAIIERCQLRTSSKEPRLIEDPAEVVMRDAAEDDVEQMANLFSKVFSSYPTPVDNPGYLQETMRDDTHYKLALDSDGELVSIASAAIDENNLNAEMTDCATLPEYRGQGVSSSIIEALERELALRGIITLYSLSRAINPSINAIFSRQGYSFSGRLKNNCDICGDYEDMNIWAKQVSMG